MAESGTLLAADLRLGTWGAPATCIFLGALLPSHLRLSPFVWAGETGCLVCSGQGTPVTVQVPRWWLAWPGSTVALAVLPRCLCSCHLRSLGALKGRVSRFRIIHTVVVYIRSLASGCLYTVQVMGTCEWPEAFGSAVSVLWMSVCFFRQLLAILELELTSFLGPP